MNDEVRSARAELATVKEDLSGIEKTSGAVDPKILEAIEAKLEAAEARLEAALQRASEIEKDAAAHADHDH